MSEVAEVCHLDFEVYSDLPIKKVGAYRFCRHPSAEALICCYQLPSDHRVHTWLPRTEPPPTALMRWVRNGGKLGAHNAAFERLVWRYILPRMFPGQIPPAKDAQWVCTAAKAAASGLPRALDKALKALGTDVAKDAEGSKLIKVFCQPRKPTKKDARTRILPEQDERFQRFVAYCQQDVRGEAELHHRLPDLIPRERRMYILDLVMNDRGLPIDLPLVDKALTVVQELERGIAARVAAITGGIKATQVQKMLDFFTDRGIDLENMRAQTIKDALKDKIAVLPKLDATARELLELRVEAGRASTKKLIAMQTYADPDDAIVQGGFLYHGAHTGRYAARGIQPHNFIRGLLKEHQRELVFALLEYADPELFLLLYDAPIDVISQCMRGFIRAPEGYEFAVVDYTAIEARVLAWLCGEEKMLAAYRKGVDVYKLMAVKLYRLRDISEVTDEQRRIAKNLVLGCGYQLGGVKFVDYAANAGVIITEEFAKRAVRTYRDDVPNIVASWKEVERLVAYAIRHPDEVVKGLKCRFYMREHWLCIQLPSGRDIRYPYAKAVPTEKWGKPAWDISFRTEYKGQFVREKTYGGKLIENIVQGIARDIMMEGMLQADTHAYPVCGTVHDELLTLRKCGTTDLRELERLVCDIPAWGNGIPLAAKGFVTNRYKKD